MIEEPAKRRPSLALSLTLSFMLVCVCWLMWMAATVTGWHLERLGVWPRDVKSLTGVVTMIFAHGSLEHLYSNSFPLFFFTAAIIHLANKRPWLVLLFITLFAGLGTWVIGRPTSWHIGASGLVYGEAAFILASGIFYGNTRMLAVSILILLYYGTMWIGILPLVPGMSWEGHLSGAVGGLVAAFIFRQPKDRQKYVWEDEPADDSKPSRINDFYQVRLPHQKSDN